MKVNLSQPQRIVVALLYLVLLIAIFLFLGGNLKALVFDASNDRSIWFYTGALLIVLGKYVAEPFFTKPTDSLANSLAVIIALIGLDVKESLFAYTFILIFSITILSLTLLSVGFKDSQSKTLKWTSNNAYWISVNLGSSKVIFSLVFLSSIYSYLAIVPEPDIIGFIILLAFWICIVFFDVIGKIVEFILKFKAVADRANYELGKAIGCENPLLYKVEIENSGTAGAITGKLVTVENTRGMRAVGIIINVRQLLSKKWLSIYLLTDEKEIQIKVPSAKTIFGSSKSIMNTENSVFLINSENNFHPDIIKKIKENYLFKSRDKFIGYVESGTNLNTLKFHLLSKTKANKVSEGSILTVSIQGIRTLYQVIDGQTREEPLENKDIYGYTVGIARKIGFYKTDKNELDVVPWMPDMFTSVFNNGAVETSEEELIVLAESSIGRLPKTNYQIPIKDYNSIVTHNTAILGILGIGKSCLTFELIKKLLQNTSVKVICIDITNQYQTELKSYINDDLIVNDIEVTERTDLKNNNANGTTDNPTTWGNIELYKTKLDKAIKDFGDGDKRVLLFNPDWHSVSKAGSQFKIQHKIDMSVAEKTRIICERTFMKVHTEGETTDARILIVFEEAHSLVPEWNSIANEGDKTAVNGTAKVILQGRKYGLGSLVITQRTANISKSILNQCNTIFALRVFDDTGKQFLENYIGSDYSNTLPTLEERHAIAVGKALKLKQPIIIQLNDREHVIHNTPNTLPIKK